MRGQLRSGMGEITLLPIMTFSFPVDLCGSMSSVPMTSPNKAMKARISLVTLGVDDLERSVAFYRDGLGLATQGIVGTEFEFGAVAFFDLQPGLRLAIWPRSSIARDCGIRAAPPSPTDFTLAHNVASRDEVDAVIAQARRAGAVIVKEAHDTFYGGYAGYFQDPDQHLWEVAWNPGFKIE